MGKLAVDRFLALVARSGLVEADRLATLERQWKSQASAQQLDDSEDCGAFFVSAGALTPWQCHKLLDGRHRGFMLGNYKLLDHLGSGGMSNVYLAEHVLMQRRVAIKVLPEHRVADASYLARFQFEGQAVAALDHPNIVRAYDLGSEGKIHYLVMEYVEGSDLEALVERAGPLPYHVAARYVLQAAEGLEHAHQAGLVHRDIKPANLLVDRQGTVKVLDMGLARFKAEVRPVPEFARHEQVLGTAAYFAPEQAVNSQTADARADIYGLGCTLYYLLTGHPPFRGETPLELMNAHHRQTAPSIVAERPDAPAPLVAICQKMMEKSPERRFQSAREVSEALARWLETERQSGRLPPGTGGEPAGSASAAAVSWGDTDHNLQDTARIDRLAKQRTSASSHVFSSADPRSKLAAPESESDVIVPPPPPTPPVAPPPRDAQRVAVPVVRPAAQNSLEVPRATAIAASAPGPFAPRISPARSIARRSRAGVFWSAMFLAALAVAAVLLAIFAIDR
jgi:serine/threonine protein kinase